MGFMKHISSIVHYCFYFNLSNKYKFSTSMLSYEIEMKLKCGERNFFSAEKILKL